MRVILLTLLTLCLYRSSLNAQDYIQYHKAINKAEEQIFVQKKIPDGLKTYSQVFDQYDFVFLHDCMNAMQIALYANDEKSFLKFTDKATKNGLKMANLAKFYYITKHPYYAKHKDSIASRYPANRQHYLRRLDTATLIKLYDLFATDQTQKNSLKGEKDHAFRSRYRAQIAETMKSLKKLAVERGFPSDKIIGIAQNNIMAELKTGTPDLMRYYDMFKDYSNIHKSTFEVYEYESAANLIFPIMVHYGGYHNYTFFDDSFYMEQIKKGDLHPKDLAGLNDDWYIRVGNPKPGINKGDKYYGVWEWSMGPEMKTTIPDPTINKLRAKYFIAPIENDRAKQRFMTEQKMYNGWGWRGNRS